MELYELSSPTCPSGEPVLTRTEYSAAGEHGFSMHRRDNLVMEVETHTDSDIEHTLDEEEREQTAQDLLCDAMGRLWRPASAGQGTCVTPATYPASS